MNILLLNPSTPQYLPNKEYVLSSAMLALSAILQRANFFVKILDFNIHRPWEIPDEQRDSYLENLLVEAVGVTTPSLVGIGCLFSGQFPAVMKFSVFLKEKFPTLPVVIGGMHPTIFPVQILKNCPSIDYVVMGEGEQQILSLAEGIRNRSFDLDPVDGIAFRKNGNIIMHPKRKFLEDLDTLPLPAYNLIDFKDYHHDTSHWHNPKKLSFRMTVPIISSRSCPMRCNFCSMFLVMGPKIRFRSPQNVVDEIQWLYDQYGQRHFSFMDDNINFHKNHILSICNLIVQRKLDIQFETPNGLMVSTLDKEVMDKMVEAGWVRGAIAIESGSDFIRNQVIGKRISRQKIMEVISLAKSYKNLYLKAYFIIGMPEDTRETLKETYEMIQEINIDDPYVTNLIPFPGTAVFEQALRDKLFIENLDFTNLWRMDGFHYHENKRFYIKPYRLELKELEEFRGKFDALLCEMKGKRILGRKYA